MSRLHYWRWFSVVLFLCAVWAAGQASYIVAKAELAQYLLERAWDQSAGGDAAVRPWPWADTWPAARLGFPRLDRELLVLDGASGRNLAFGPAHLAHTPWPGVGGATLIAGHRDTHFALLEELGIGDRVTLERHRGTQVYRVDETLVVHQDAAAMLDDGTGEALLLVTCYPFGAVDPGTEWRYVVRALPQNEASENFVR